ncbi:hypothetical protein K7640_09500 [Micromonospora sp. PLK6-60]|uniref:hypothetical protein n=1 Tax=Micromonospora sp. PLK6-60 TaxID=2873383 RepID=UPI001CA69AA2|nr:hypothetical protein [Micromonospora sp. PLK6-60]MBY8872073.1 hypothetical protein [Micromonospora sp. PLK6-60]
MDRADRTSLAWLSHPVTVLALLVLVVNDHLLKAAHPGWLTGKLSDVAGLVLAPPLVATLAALTVPRLPARAAAGLGLGLVGAGFAVVKSSGYAAALASAAWSLVSGPALVRADRTDLLTLPALAVAGWTWRRARRDPVAGRSARLVRLLVLLPAATLAVAATTAYWFPDAQRATVLDGKLVAGVGGSLGDDGVYPVDTWRVSEDAGASWRDPLDAEDRTLVRQYLGVDPAPPPVRRACVPAAPRHCYRLVEGRLRVQESDDAGRTWRTAWEVTAAQRAVLSRRYDEAGWFGDRLTGQELTVFEVGAGRHVVLVANGRDGFVLRDADGGWRRIGFVGARAGSDEEVVQVPALGVSTPAQRHADPLRVALFAFLLSMLVLVLAGVRAGWRGGSVIGTWQVLGVLLFLPGAGAMLLAVLGDDLSRIPGILGGLLLVPGSAVFSLIPHRAVRVPARWLVEVLLAAALTLVLAGLPLVGWLYGRPAYALVAFPLAVLAALPGLGLAWRAHRLVTTRVPDPEPPYPAPGGTGRSG